MENAAPQGQNPLMDYDKDKVDEMVLALFFPSHLAK